MLDERRETKDERLCHPEQSDIRYLGLQSLSRVRFEGAGSREELR